MTEYCCADKLVLIRARVHPFPSRTRKLSSLLPTILGWRRPGKIGSANTKAHDECRGLLLCLHKWEGRIFIVSKWYAANYITASRVFFAPLLLFFSASSPCFFTLHLLCGLSDMLDGAVARRTKAIAIIKLANLISDFFKRSSLPLRIRS